MKIEIKKTKPKLTELEKLAVKFYFKNLRYEDRLPPGVLTELFEIGKKIWEEEI